DGVTDLNEGWNYTGCVVLLAIGVYVVTRLRGWPRGGTDPPLLDRLVGLSAVFVVLSLTGGPSVLIYDVVPFFRSYGRAGLLALALWCVAAPVILFGLAQRWPWYPLRIALLVGALALALYEGNQYSSHPYAWRRTVPDPSWVGWLARQPADVRLASFPFDNDDNRWYPFYLSQRHGHATLNGCEVDPLLSDLSKHGATLDKMTPDGFRFL